MSYAKLHSVLLDSSIWGEPYATRVVWVTALAMANWDGLVEASVSGIAHRARVTPEEARVAIDAFLAPDQDSRDNTSGERMRRVEGGYLILNYEKYRDRDSIEHRREKDRLRQQRKRDRDNPDRHVTSRDSNVMSRTVTPVTPSDADQIRPEVQSTSPPARSDEPAEPQKRSKRDERFEWFWDVYNRKVEKKAAMAAWKDIDFADEELIYRIIEKATAYSAAHASDRHYQKHPHRWLKGRMWEDEEVAPSNGHHQNGRAP